MSGEDNTMNEYEVFYIATARTDGKAPSPVKALYSRIYYTEEDAQRAARRSSKEVHAIVVRAVMRYELAQGSR